MNGADVWTALVSGNAALAVAHGDLPHELWSDYAASTLVAWDIETSGLEWRTDRIGTCQIFAEGIGTVVVSVDDARLPRRLMALLQDPGVAKVFHHAPFDLRFMVGKWGARPASVRCTKVASKLLNPQARHETHSLEHLVADRLGVHLSKGPVRTSNWLAETLSSEQVEYAAADVMHLPLLLESLSTELDQRGLAWLYDQCCTFLPTRAVLEVGNYPDVFSY